MNDYKKVYEDAAKIHEQIRKLETYKKNALSGVDCTSLHGEEREFVKNAIIAAYEPRIDSLMRKFFKVHEENKEAAETPKDKECYEFNFDTYRIVLDADMFNDARYKCVYTDVNCNNCILNDIPCICNELQGMYTRGEYRIIKSKEE